MMIAARHIVAYSERLCFSLRKKNVAVLHGAAREPVGTNCDSHSSSRPIRQDRTEGLWDTIKAATSFERRIPFLVYLFVCFLRSHGTTVMADNVQDLQHQGAVKGKKS